MTEFRAWVSVPGITAEDEDTWMRLMDDLNHHHGDLGPVASWDEPGTMQVVLADDADSPAAATRAMVDVVADALQRTGLGAYAPTAIDLEPA